MFHKCYLLPSFKDVASFCFMHSLKILLLLLWVGMGCVFPLPFCMHAAQTGCSAQSLLFVLNACGMPRCAKVGRTVMGTGWAGPGVCHFHPDLVGVSP